MTDSRDPWERWVELTIYAPLGLVVTLQEDLPRYIRQGRQTLEQRITVARWIGQMAVEHGRRQLAQRQAAPAPPEGRPAPAPISVPIDAPRPAVHAPDPIAPPVAPPAADELPIQGYESLAALHVVPRLASLSDDELDAVARFETAHRGRRTILAKIAQLRGDGAT